MKRCIMLLAIVVLCAAPSAFACRSDKGNTTLDVTTYKQNLNLDLADYGVIFEEAAPWSPCTQQAADALYSKLFTTFHPETIGFNSWATGISDDQVGFTLHAPFQGWLGGGDVALIHATGLRLANVHKLTKPLDDLIRQINYQLNVDHNCGWDNFWGKDQNSCMDDYSVGAMGYSWIAAFRAKRGLSDVATPEAAARTAVNNALSTDHFSICAWDGVTYKSTAPDNPCTGTLSDIINNGYIPISFHTGDSIPYGFGLLTSIASASVAIKLADPSSMTPFLTTDQQAVVQKLYLHSMPHTNYAATNPVTFDWTNDCSRFTKQGDGSMVVTPDNVCGANTPSPKMFPLDAFINTYAPPVASSEPKFDIFDTNLFCDGVDYCAFFSAGRRAVYGQMAHDWVVSGPNFTATGLADYTVTLQTYNGNYLSARNGGGADLDAEPTSAGSNEQFSLFDRTNTTLTDGDVVTIQSLATQNAQWVSAEDGGGVGSVANANRIYPNWWESFTIHKLNGTGTISNGDPVALTSANGYYVSANDGGGNTVTVDRTAVITWERFTVGLSHN